MALAGAKVLVGPLYLTGSDVKASVVNAAVKDLVLITGHLYLRADNGPVCNYAAMTQQALATCLPPGLRNFDNTAASLKTFAADNGELTFASLARIGGDLHVHGSSSDNGNRALTSLSFPSLQIVDGDRLFVSYVNDLESLLLPALEGVTAGSQPGTGISINGNGKLVDLDLSGLVRVSGSFTLKDCSNLAEDGVRGPGANFQSAANVNSLEISYYLGNGVPPNEPFTCSDENGNGLLNIVSLCLETPSCDLHKCPYTNSNCCNY